MKTIIAAVLIGMFVVSLPTGASAKWFGEDLTASIFSAVSSFFGKVASAVSETANKVFSPKKSSEVSTENCVPPVPAKPAGIDLVSPYGSFTITPEVSTASPDNMVTISLSPNLDDVNFVRIYTPFPADLNDDIIDWYPKAAPNVSFSRQNYLTGDGAFSWSISSLPTNDTNNISARQNYWIKIRMQDATIQKQAKNTTDADGWRKISYTVNGLKPGRIKTEAKGSQGFYVGTEQKPSLITTIGNDSFKRTFYSGTPSLKPFTVAPNGYFEIQTKSLGQPGTITLGVKNAKILNGAKQEVKADETITWKIQPLGTDPVRLLELSLKNTCGEDYLVDPAKSATLADSDTFTFPIIYDTAVPKKSDLQSESPAPTPKPTPESETILPPQTTKVSVQKLIVSANKVAPEVTEGNKITFTAKLMMADGSLETTTDVKWAVLGKIGTITSQGVFTAKLDESIAELGESFGFVTATYIDSEGNVFLGQSTLLKVKAFVLDQGETSG